MKNKISILIFNGNEPLPKQGGMERVTDSLARGLKDKGFNVILLCKNKNRLGERYTPPIPLYFIPKENSQNYIKQIIQENNITHIIDQGEGEIIGKFGYFKKRYPLFNDITMIAVQHSSAKAIIKNYKIALKKNFNNYIKQFIYNNFIIHLKKIHSTLLIKKLYKDLNLNYDKIVTLSPSFIEDFVSFYKKTDRNKLISIPNMNSYDKTNNTQKENRVLFVGRLNSEIKGCDKLLRIWKEASTTIDDWHLDVVGDGPDRENLGKMAKDLNIKNCTFHGFCNPQPFYEKAQIFCMTSVFEGFGMVLTEAMQHSVIHMAFNSYSSVNDIITNNKDGYIISAFDEKEYADKLKNLIKNQDLRTKLATEAKISSERFSRDKVFDMWEKLIINTFNK